MWREDSSVSHSHSIHTSVQLRVNGLLEHVCFRTSAHLPPPPHTQGKHANVMKKMTISYPSSPFLWDHIVIAAGQIDISFFFLLPDTKTLICNCIFIFLFFGGNIPKDLGDYSTVTSSVKL